MNWISNYVRPTINSLFSRREVPENLWSKCPECGTMLFHRELADNLNVCTTCDHHMAISPRERFKALFDGGIFTEVKVPEAVVDPLHFRDQKKYPDRLKAAQKATGEKEAMLVAEGEIQRTPVVAVAQDFSFMAGSMGMYVGNALIAAAQTAVAHRRPLIVFSAAGGARMQEGILSLMQMPRTTVAVQMVKEARLPYVVVLTHPTTGGVTASYGMLGDVQIAEPNALICFAGPRVIEQTIREKLPEGFQRAEYLLDHGMLDRVTHRKAMREELVTILRMLTGQPPAVKGDLPAPVVANGAAPGVTTSDVILERMTTLHPKVIDLVMDRVERLLAALGHPERSLPPVVHIAGTNGKGSTQAMMRAGFEATGAKVHAYTSPHLARFHERIRIAGEFVTEPALIALLDECAAANGADPITFFEITTAAAFLAFARTPADWTLLEVGLGGEFDATNVVEKPALTVITPVSIDHQQYLGETLGEIAVAKAGIIKRGVPCVVGPQEDAALAVIERKAARMGAPLLVHGQHWQVAEDRGRLVFQDDNGLLDLPLPNLPGPHQVQNAGAALMALRHLGFGEAACEAAVTRAFWPARMQRLRTGPLVRSAPKVELWLDGGHNPAGGAAVAATLARMPQRETHLICGMLNTKDVRGYMAPLAGQVTALHAVSIPGEKNTLPAEVTRDAARAAGIMAETSQSVVAALAEIAANSPESRVLICGSLYLAGVVLRENG